MSKSYDLKKIRSCIDQMDEEEVMLVLDKCYERLIDRGWQWGDVLYGAFGWLNIHADHAREEYLDGTHPEFKYGPKKR